MNEPQVYPFGRPVTPRPASASTPRPLFVLGAYPSALHVEWRPTIGKLVRAIPVDDEPEPFWNGADAQARMAEWLDWLRPESQTHGTFSVPARFNGPSGAWVDTNILSPLGYKRSDTWITDCLDTYRMSTGVAARIDDTYAVAGLPACHLGSHLSEDAIVREALSVHRARLRGELDRCRPDTVATLGNAAARVFAELAGLGQRKLTISGYGASQLVELAGRELTWYSLAHPAAPVSYQNAHEAWVATRRKVMS